MKFCENPFKYAYLAPQGEVRPCPWMHITLGNLYEQDIADIWHSPAAETARRSIKNGSFAFCRKTSCHFLEKDELPDLSEEEFAQKAKATDLPVYINIANDLTCNIACTTCRKGVYCPGEGEKEKIDSALEDILPVANQAELLELNGYGEFLANPSFIRLLNRLEPVRDDLKILLETNGVLFDEYHWEQFSHLSKYDLRVTVTLNSLRRDVYRYLSGGFDHRDRVLENLRFLSKLRRDGKINLLSVTMVVQDCNFWEVPEYIRTLSDEREFMFDTIMMKPLYKWYKMDEETYWFKNILNPQHPYHRSYLKILEDDCWKDPKVYDWGCHNIRESIPHPLKQEEIYRKILSRIYDNEDGLMPAEYLKKCVDRLGAKRIGFYGKNEFSLEFAKLLRETGAEIFQLTWALEDCCGEFTKVAKQDFKPDMADAMLIIDFFKGGYWFNDLRALGYRGPIVTVEDLVLQREHKAGESV